MRKTKKYTNTVKHTLAGCKGKYDLTHITIICGHKVLFSGIIDNFFSNCNIAMVNYRNQILEREVIAKDILNNNKLFLFIKAADAESEV